MEHIIQLILYFFSGYLSLGILFSIFFFSIGINKIDEVAVGSSLGFKLIIFPGVVVFWVFLFYKWIKQN